MRDCAPRPEVNPALKLALMVRRAVTENLGSWSSVINGAIIGWGSLGMVALFWFGDAQGLALFLAPVPALCFSVAALAAWELIERELRK